MTKTTMTSVTAMLMGLGLAAPALAAEHDVLAADRFLLRARVIDVAPAESTNSVTIGGKVNAGDGLAPEVDLSYFFTSHLAAELIAATTQHSLSHSGAGDLGRTWVLPPTVTLQYHFAPRETFSPYIGAGLNYSMFYGEEAAKANGITKLDVQGGVGYALQAGADFWLSEHWGLNVDVKKLFLNVDAKLNGGAIKADVDLDPWVFGAGVSYHF